jgi:hypothetical protein
MSDDETQPVSGSRWEQQPDQPSPPSAAQPPGPPPGPPAAVPAYASAPQPRNRGRLLLAGGAVGVALVAGTAGFALGHATGDDDRDGPGRFRFMQDGGPPGTFPGQGQPPGSFPDRDGDGRDFPDDGQGPPDDGAGQDAPNT